MNEDRGTQYIKDKATKFYQRCDWIRASIDGGDAFPWGFPIGQPSPRDILEDFASLRVRARELEGASRANVGHGYSLAYKEVRHRQLGEQRVPVSVSFETGEELARFLGRGEEFNKVLSLIQVTREKHPGLLALLRERPRILVEHASVWTRLLDVCTYFLRNPMPGLYARSLDIPGVDTKFLEGYKGVLWSMLDRVLPESAVDQAVSSPKDHGFERRFGLKFELPRIRCRLLCDDLKRKMSGLDDLEMPIDQFSMLALPVRTVFVTENKTNGLAFPALPNSMVVFGLGYALELLADASWLEGVDLYYWSDIDTHGFAMLSRFRRRFPHSKSLLMDRGTLLQCFPLWGAEGVEERHTKPIGNLTPEEADVYDGLLGQEWGENVRLEQERIPFALLQARMESMRGEYRFHTPV